MRKLFLLAALGAGALVAVQWPELKRYMNMRNM